MPLITGNVAGRGHVRVAFDRGRISDVLDTGLEDPAQPWVSPGFVDLQINGFASIDFSDRLLEPEQAISILPALWRTGVTSFYPTLITNSPDRLRRGFRVLEHARRASATFERCVPGYHLEGPFFPAGPARGVHDPAYLRPPKWDEFVRLQEAAGGNIRIVTLAPELPGALDFIRRCTERDVLCAIAHTEATAFQIHAAVEAGARLSTHLGNGCANLLDRHRNPLWPQLANDRLFASLICDTFHLPPDLVRVIVKAKRVERCILVTDAIHVAMMNPGRYNLVDTPVNLLPDGKVVKADGSSMAGSAVSMNRAVDVFETYGGVSLADALQAATTRPAVLLKSPAVCSDLASGEPANLMRFARGSGELEILDVWIGGDQVVASGGLT